MMAAYFLRGHGHAEPKPGIVMRGYERLLKASLRFRWVTLAAGIGFFIGSIYAMGFLPSGFIPREDASRIVFSLELPPGSRLDDTRATTDEVTKLMLEVPEVENVYVIGGASPTGTLETRRATVVADLKHKSERDIPQHEIEGILLDRMETIPDLRAYFVNDRGERQLAFGVMGTDGAVLDQPGAQDPERDGRDRQIPRDHLQCRARPAGSHRRARSGAARRARHLDGDDRRDAAHRHHGRHRRESGEVHRRRPADPDPRAAH